MDTGFQGINYEVLNSIQTELNYAVIGMLVVSV
jgi:hypothetical protein